MSQTTRSGDGKFTVGLIMGLVGGLAAGIMLTAALLDERGTPAPATPVATRPPAQIKEIRAGQVILMVARGQARYKCAPGQRTYDLVPGQTLRGRSGLYLQVSPGRNGTVTFEARPGLWSVAEVVITRTRSKAAPVERRAGITTQVGMSLKTTLPGSGVVLRVMVCMAGPQG